MSDDRRGHSSGSARGFAGMDQEKQREIARKGEGASSSTTCATAAALRPSLPTLRGRGPAPRYQLRSTGASWGLTCNPAGLPS